jgi:exodeoxyribonuclease-3
MYPANKAGYSGTAILSKRQADDVSYGLGFELCDNEGRFITARYDDLHISSLYLPSAYGTTQPRKDNFLDEFASRLDIPNHILCGDFNICHRAIDMYRPDDEVSGFLPHEQMWMDDLMQEYTDCWRALNPDKVAYSWWSHRNNAFQNNHGWRIDYCLSNHLKPVKSVIDMVRFSDHSPVITDFEDL